MLPAHATGGYSPPQRVASCEASGDIVAVADTSIWGVLSCGRALQLVHRTPAGSWSSRQLPFTGVVRAVADDGRTTFFLFSPPYQPSGTPLLIAKVPHGGAPSASRVLTQGGEEVPAASLVARDGKWWAVWDTVAYTGDARSARTVELHHARTIEPAFAPRRIPLGAGQHARPFLALRDEELRAVLALTRSPGPDGYGRQEPVLATAGRDGTFVERELSVTAEGEGVVDDLAVSSGRTAIVLHDGPRTLLAVDDLSMRFTTREVPTRSETRTVSLAMSGGRVFVGHSECFTASTGRFTCRAYVAEGALTGALATTEVSAPLGRQDPGVLARALVVTAARGRATAVTTVEGRASVTQTQR